LSYVLNAAMKKCRPKDQIRSGEEEGVKIDMSWGPKQILLPKARGLRRRASAAPPATTRPTNSLLNTTKLETKKVEGDLVITAIDQISDLSLWQPEARSASLTTKRGTFEVDPRS
jgi:hypothetical protein